MSDGSKILTVLLVGRTDPVAMSIQACGAGARQVGQPFPPTHGEKEPQAQSPLHGWNSDTRYVEAAI